MIFKLLSKIIPSLLYSIIFLGIFYWQFIYIYSLIIEKFSTDRLFILYEYIFIYLFGVLILTVSIINLIDIYIIKRATFTIISISTIIIFYILSFHNFYHIIEFFIKYPLSYSAIMGIIFFILLSFGYGIYSVFIALFKKSIPLWHISIFLILGLLYSIGFIYTAPI